MTHTPSPYSYNAGTPQTGLPPPSSVRFAPVCLASPPEGERLHIQDGRELRLRGIEPSDVPALKRCFNRLSPEDVRRRFMHAMAELPEPMAQRLCRIDPTIETAYVLMDESTKPSEMCGVGRIYVDESAASAEFSVLIEQDWTRLGLGALLLQRLVDDCRHRGLTEIWGYVLVENRPMLELCKELGFTRRLALDEPGTALISLQL
ncbi:GNAT family N-acetyltransferase [Dyella tabacisoli]|uniref:N-acetyltransferase n=1 Tax=Dyella tabacisoli TaxID=2282381 RepID=A0A369UTD7_9GAMM|nr:GNAT family N-acetyltransferase [Dyella tabacisoli]RDD83771.1 N-acetyltransferase [Dyella tabacisoli]